MADMKEKLVELLDDIQLRGEDFTDYEIYGMRLPDTVSNEDVASHLIAHGVTVQEWIPVTERLPEAYKQVLAYRATGCEVEDCVDVQRGIWANDSLSDYPVTHWMPLPEPPKE